MLFSLLIRAIFQKENKQVAILVDEYDAPVTAFLDGSETVLNDVRRTLCNYYVQLKSNDDYISFVFVTGITKDIPGWLYSAFNNPTDISLSPKYSAIVGFTQEELELYYGKQIEELAINNKVTVTKVLKKIKNFYNGYSFDGQTFVYNPFCLLLLFENNYFGNYWYNSAKSEQIVSFMKHNELTLSKYSRVKVERNKIEKPSPERNINPAVYLYQLGYLSLRRCRSDNWFILDYPNKEVKMAFARQLLDAHFNNIEDDVINFITDLHKAIIKRNPIAFTSQLNLCLSRITYRSHGKNKRDEEYYRNCIMNFLSGAGFEPRAESEGNIGRTDIEFTFKKVSWILELKVNKEQSGDKQIASKALKQIQNNNYGGRYTNPILYGFVINDNHRLITAWKCQNGTATEWELTENDDVTESESFGPKQS
jgi:hypothetical protein